MYTKHFDLRHEPFSIAPDPRYLFMSERHREALAHLLYGLQGSGGVVLLTGEIGAGKTTVCRCFLEQIPKKSNVAYIFNPKLTVPELLRTVCDEFHVSRTHINTAVDSVKDYVDAINEFLLRTHAVGQNNVLIIDEAQNLSVDVLEQLRLLTNLETTQRKLLQIILIGQPELRGILAQPQLEQLAQRVTARYHLEALNEVETTQYMRHRLSVAGRAGAMPFDREARSRVFALSRGVPRRINLLCDRAMLGAYAAGVQRINGAMVDQSAKEVFGATPVNPFKAAWLARGPWVGAGVLGGAMLVGLATWAIQRSSVSSEANAPVGASAPIGSGSASMAAPVGTVPIATASNSSTAATALRVGPGLPTSGAATPLLTSKPASGTSATPQPLKPLQDEKQAWRLLALTSKITLADGDPCQAASKQRLSCSKRNDGNLTVLKKLRNPAILTLRDDAGLAGYVVYTGAADDAFVTLRGAGGDVVRLDMLSFATQWRGEISTFKSVAASN